MRYCKRRRVDNRRPRPRPRPREQQQQKSSSAIPIHPNHICESHSHRVCTTALNHHHHYKDATANKSAFPSPPSHPHLLLLHSIQPCGRVNENFVGEKKWLHRSSRLLVDTRFELTPFCSLIACSGWRIIIIVIPPIPTLIHGTDSEPESASNNKWKCPSSTHHIPAKDETELARGSVRDQTRHHTLAQLWKGGEETEERQGRDNVLNKGRRSRVSRQTTTVCSGGCWLVVVFHSPHPPPLFIHRPYPYLYIVG